MLGVSLRTVHRRMDEYCLTVHSCYTDIDDARVDHIVRELKKQFPGHHLPEDGTTPYPLRTQTPPSSREAKGSSVTTPTAVFFPHYHAHISKSCLSDTLSFCIYCTPITVLLNGTCYMQSRGGRTKKCTKEPHPSRVSYDVTSSKKHYNLKTHRKTRCY